MSEVIEMADVYVWDIADVDADDGRRFGGKATGLARMAAAGIPVPPAFVVGTDAFRAFAAGGRRLPPGLRDQIERAVARLGDALGRRFGGHGEPPLLVSVRSGAQVSMPGMMDTVLNLGLDARGAEWLLANGAERGFVVDTWLRFWKMYAEIVLGLDGDEFVEALAAPREAAEHGELAPAALERAVLAWLDAQGETAPTDPAEQLCEAVCAVFRSWDSPRAKAYREHQHIPHDLGTAVTVQAMVFGNADANSGSGVAFSRNPNTGEAALYGEYLVGRQGEDIVSGARTPVDLSRDEPGYEDLRHALAAHARVLERLYGDAVDIEFTVESGTLYLLQVRPAKRTAEAAVRIAVDLAASGMLAPSQAVGRVSAEQVRRLLRPVFDPEQLAAAEVVARGIGSSPGQTSGIAVLDADRAVEQAAAGRAVVLVRPTTSPLDIRGMLAAEGVLTARGGALSHAAVVSRALDKPCVVGCEALAIDPEARTFAVGGRTWREGDPVAINGATGEVYAEALRLAAPTQGTDSLARLLRLADRVSGAQVWAASGTRGAGDADLPGLAVIGLTDIAIATGEAAAMIETVRRLARGGGRDAERQLADAAQRLAAAAIAAGGGRTLHLRLPVAASARARMLMPDWEEFDPRVFLPVGNPAYVRAWLGGLSAAASAAGTTLTVLLGGATEVGEWRQFRREVDAFAGLEGGMAVQSAAGLEQAPEMLAEGALLWLDVEEIVHSAHGFVSIPNVSGAILDDYVAQGAIAMRPDAQLRPFLRELVARVAQADGARRAGVAFGPHVQPELVAEVYALGFRRISVPIEQRDVIRLVLGQRGAA
ncbi:MAG TPA: pyruvate, phosphate dikinase [Dokdonella sp.]